MKIIENLTSINTEDMEKALNVAIDYAVSRLSPNQAHFWGEGTVRLRVGGGRKPVRVTKTAHTVWRDRDRTVWVWPMEKISIMHAVGGVLREDIVREILSALYLRIPAEVKIPPVTLHDEEVSKKDKMDLKRRGLARKINIYEIQLESVRGEIRERVRQAELLGNQIEAARKKLTKLKE